MAKQGPSGYGTRKRSRKSDDGPPGKRQANRARVKRIATKLTKLRSR